MRLGMPHFGYSCIAVKAIAQRLGDNEDIKLIVPPPSSQRTLDFGVKYSPTEACLPFKLTLGNLVESCELGADTLLQGRGTGICRLGYYVKEQEQILQDLGYNAHFVTVDVSRHKFRSMMGAIRAVTNNAPWPRVISAFSFGVGKLFALDRIEAVVHKARARELERGMANQIYRKTISAIDEATSSREVRKLTKECMARINKIPKDSAITPVKVSLVGEVFVVLDPFANMDIEMELGKLGVEVDRAMSMSRWIKYNLFLNKLGINEWRDVRKAAMPYLKRDVGGEGWESVGEKVVRAQNGYDGVIHLAPFTCMPEIVAQNIMPSTKEDIPVLTVLCDEQMARQGMITRLEAFVDLVRFRRKRSRQ